jgi:hypothetical protein
LWRSARRHRIGLDALPYNRHRPATDAAPDGALRGNVHWHLGGRWAQLQLLQSLQLLQQVQRAAAVVVQKAEVSGALQAFGQGVLQQRPQEAQPFNREEKNWQAGVSPLISNLRHQKTQPFLSVLRSGTLQRMKSAHQRTLEAVFVHPTSANIAWKDIAALFTGLGAEVSEHQGSRVSIFLFNEVRVFHRPHPSPKTDKGAVVPVKKRLEQHGVKP